MNKPLFYLIWLLIISIGPITVLRNTPLEIVTTNQTLTLNFLQRLAGLLAFSLITWQIILGSFMEKWTLKLGAWVLKFHITEGGIIYSLVILHPLLFMLFNFKLLGKLDPFFVFTDFCLLCKTQLDFYYTFGRITFWLITVAVIAAKFRTHPLLRLHWRKFHVFNYLAFFLIALHSWFVGTDVHTTPFSWFFWVAVIAVSLTVFHRLLRLTKFFKASS